MTVDAEGMTVAEAAALPAVVDLMTAARALRIRRTTAYALAPSLALFCASAARIECRRQDCCGCWALIT